MSLITHKLPVVLICLFIFAPFLRSQDSMPGAFAMYGDGKSPHNNSLKAIDSVVIDTSLLTVRYKASYWMYPGGTPTWHTAVLNVGAPHSLFYDFSMHIRNRYSYIQLMKCDRLGPGHDVEMEELMKESAHSFTALSCLTSEEESSSRYLDNQTHMVSAITGKPHRTVPFLSPLNTPAV